MASTTKTAATALGLLLLLSAPAALSSANDEPEFHDEGEHQRECGLYLAESSIPGAGFGVFSGIDIEEGELVGEPEIAIQLMNIHINERLRNEHELMFLPKEYAWNFGSFEAKEVDALIPGLGMLTNFHTGLKNVIQSGHDGSYDDTLLSRAVDPGAGAITYYRNINMTSSRFIAAGEEIFSDYGENWILTRPYMEKVPLQRDYKDADMVMNRTAQLLLDIFPNTTDGNHEEHLSRLPDIMSTVKSIATSLNEKMDSLLPGNETDLHEQIISGSAWNSVIRRTVPWLRDNGRCLDNIKPGVSNTPGAGYGAFSKRSISKGELIIPAPLVHVPDKRSLEMYDFIVNHDGELIRTEEGAREQLLTNYCFGHPQSSLLMCPSTYAVLINHKSSKVKNRGIDERNAEGPNAEYRWSTWNHINDEWHRLSIDDLSDKEHQGLSIDIVATKDIEVGEEIFFDYGDEWEESWQRYVDSWSPSDISSYESVSEMNKRREFRTASELRFNPYPSNVMTACVYWEDDDANPPLDINFLVDFMSKDPTIDEMIEHLSIDGEMFAKEPNIQHHALWPCSVIERESNEAHFTVEILPQNYDSNTWWFEANVPRFVKSFKSDLILFVPKLGKSDELLPNRFRKSMVFRDDLFPHQWKNLKEEDLKYSHY
mmetsp:Transcript_16261/g.23951  ORF Transcript_16261/g.23951 Transcript_16261/m.23951 type:complete len:655 (-) Transcript_16261:141-2105(-)